MRNPARKALYCLLALAAGAALIRFGAVRLERIEEDGPGVAAIALGFVLAPFGFFFLVQSLFAIRGRALLLAGHRVIARWRVPAAEWDRFRGLDGRRSAEDFDLGNDLWIRRRTPPEGIEVIAGETSVLVDGSYHALRPGGIPDLREVRWLSGSPDCLEFALLYPRGRYVRTVPMTLRVPVPLPARAAAQTVLAHYERLCRPDPGLAARNPPSPYRVWLLVPAAAAALAAIGSALAATIGEDNDPNWAVAVLVAAGVTGIFALVVALGRFLFTRPGSR
ncbi:MAG TPA: hypothetical protein VF605_05465 [Allosphingosinicella sp.]|jgi:hypothetical protein